jgi:hypothetical protein
MKIAFCKFAGMANGGCEKYLQTISMLYKSHGHDVDYFYTNAAPTLGSPGGHADNNQERISLVQSKGINLFKVHVGNRYMSPYPYEIKWFDTNFFDVFKESEYEYLITAGDGRKEFPYTDLHNIKIIHTVHGFHAYNQSNIVKSVLLCKWQADRWIANGGNSSRAEIIPPLVAVPNTWTKTFREKNNIPADAFVYGLHQGNGVGSLVSLQAFASLNSSNCYYAFLGGSDAHRQYCRANNIKNVIFLDSTSSVNDIHDFLDGIDVYAHCRIDGEVASACIIEAMAHSKPIVSFIGDGTNLGHLEQVENCGAMTYSVEEYAQEMVRLQDQNYYSDMSNRVEHKYKTVYDYTVVEKQLLQLTGAI